MNFVLVYSTYIFICACVNEERHHHHTDAGEDEHVVALGGIERAAVHVHGVKGRARREDGLAVSPPERLQKKTTI